MIPYEELQEIEKMIIRNYTVSLIANTVVSASLLGMSLEDACKIGKLIYQNEASCRADKLVFWSAHEPFPSLGIGHAIWYPEGFAGPYTEEFPTLCAYLKKQGVALPVWLEEARFKGAPWKSREEFLADAKKIHDLKELLCSTLDIQARFMVERLGDHRDLVVEAAPEQKREQVERCFQLMQTSLLGHYALIDYLNFKGSGLNPKEVKKGEGWGLLQVLLAMPDDVTLDNVLSAFAASCAYMLVRLIRNSGPQYSSIKYLSGWTKRVSTYCDQRLFS